MRVVRPVLAIREDAPLARFQYPYLLTSSVAAWFVLEGARCQGTRRPNKGAAAGVNREFHEGAEHARRVGGSTAAAAYKRDNAASFVPRSGRAAKGLQNEGGRR